MSVSDQDSTEMVTIGIDLSDETFITLAKEAHRRDITFNAFMVEVFLDYADKYCPTESEPGEL